MGAQPHPVGVGDPYTRGHHVVHHPGELVHAEHGEMTVRAAQPGPDQLKAVHRARTERGPHHIGQRGEDPVQVDRARAHQPMAQQMQAEVRVRGAHRGRVQVDLGPYHLGAHLA